MLVFDDIERTDIDFAFSAEPHFKYLNRSARPEVDRVRQAIEGWYSRVQSEHQPDLRMRLRSRDNLQHGSAIFEIILHELFLRRGYGVQMHPAVPAGRRRKPDFLITPPSGSPFYLEATLATGETTESIGARMRLNDVYDAIDKLETPDFFLHVEVSGAPASPLPGRKIRDWLARKLQTLDRQALALILSEGRWDQLPKWLWDGDGVSFTIMPIPKGRPGVSAAKRPQAIGSKLSLTYGTADECLRKALAEKATAYGDLELPYVVAVNSLQRTDHIDIGNALFGDETAVVSALEDGSPGPTRYTRHPNGSWVGPKGPRSTGVSGLLLFHQLGEWNAGDAAYRMYVHPWGKVPLPDSLAFFPSAKLPSELAAELTRPMPWDNAFTLTDGPSLGELLGLPSGWPYDAGGSGST